MRLARIAPLAAFAALSLSACSSGGTATVTATVASTPSSPVPTSAAPAPVVTPSSTPDDPHPALAKLFITTSGLGPLTVGQPISGNPGEAMLTWDPAFCDAAISGPGDLGRWVAAYPDAPGGGKPFYVDTSDDGVLHRIDIVSPHLTTPEGIHIGSTVADLEATYGGSLIMGTSGWGTVNVEFMQADWGTVVFETDTSMPDGTTGPDHVAFIRVLADGVDPDFTVSQSDNIAGGCE